MKYGDKVKFIDDVDIFDNNLELQSVYKIEEVSGAGWFVKINGQWYYQ